MSAVRFERLVQLHGRRVLGYLVHRVDRREDAADLLSEVLLTAWRRVEAIPADDDEALPWLLVVARHTLANHRRGALRREALADRLRARLTETEVPAVDRTMDVRDALAALDPDDRELLILTAWDGLTAAEAATVLGISAAATRKRLQRARGRMRAALEPGEEVLAEPLR